MYPEQWDKFVEENYPAVGAFMQTWAWGEFQKKLGRNVNRYSVMNGKKAIAVFTLVELKLNFGFKYGYIPRGPVVQKGTNSKKIADIFESIKKWSLKKFPQYIFLRLEPPISFSNEYMRNGFHLPSFYIQPRHNVVIDLTKSEEEILASFHSSTRSNTKRAEKRGVTVVVKDNITLSDYQAFKEMVNDTIVRNNGKNAYPSDEYFRFFLKEVPFTGFYGLCDEKPASVHFVLFFGNTATYLYGASHTAYLNSKVDTYLHWSAMREAKRRGCKYYDLGGIDPVRWPGLTAYKRQYKGMELEYMGNIDIPFKIIHYRLYSLARLIKTKISEMITKK